MILDRRHCLAERHGSPFGVDDAALFEQYGILLAYDGRELYCFCPLMSLQSD